jgi:hypothetical protein
VALELDAGAVRRGAVGAIVVFGPVVIILRALSGGDDGSSAWIVLLLVFPFAFMFAGWLAAYDRPPGPLKHGAAAGALGFAVVFLAILPFQLMGDGISLPGLFFALILVEIAAVFGLLGGLLAARGVRMR